MINLLEETIDAIKASGHVPADIVFIGSPNTGHHCTWEKFKIIADVEYDEGYGLQNVASDLVIEFSDETRLVRTEYDGSEAWRYIRKFSIPDQPHPISKLVRDEGDRRMYYRTLAELNKDEK